jgi:hypothetical protein
MKIEYDFVRFVKTGDEEDDVVLPELGGGTAKPVKAPTTYEEKELRTSDDEYGNAIRFKAAVKSQTVKNATEIGWVITAANNWAGSYEDFTLAAETDPADPKVKVAYQRQDGTDKANFFGEDDNGSVFSLVLYNIPLANMYDYVLVRPFAKSGDKVVYGEPALECLYDVAVAPYIELNDEYYTYIYQIAEVYDNIDDAFASDEDIWFTDAYENLSDAHKDFIYEILVYELERGLEMYN